MTGTRGSLAGIALLSIVIGAGLGFGLTWLVQPSGTVLQTKYLSTQSIGWKNDNDLTNTVVPNTQLNITTSGSSYLAIRFDGSLGYHLDSTFTTTTRFNITLEVNDTVVGMYKASWWRSAASIGEEGSVGVSMTWVSDTLPAATYIVSVKWASTYDAPGDNQIYFSTANRNTTRTIMVQEFRSGLF